MGLSEGEFSLCHTQHPSTPVTASSFYLFIHIQKQLKQHPKPGIISSHQQYRQAYLKNTNDSFHSRPQQSQTPPHSTSTYTSISSTHLPNTSLTIPITDTIYSPKSHCYLMPLIWDLIERGYVDAWWVWWVYECLYKKC